MKRTSYSTYTK